MIAWIDVLFEIRILFLPVLRAFEAHRALRKVLQEWRPKFVYIHSTSFWSQIVCKDPCAFENRINMFRLSFALVNLTEHSETLLEMMSEVCVCDLFLWSIDARIGVFLRIGLSGCIPRF